MIVSMSRKASPVRRSQYQRNHSMVMTIRTRVTPQCRVNMTRVTSADRIDAHLTFRHLAITGRGWAATIIRFSAPDYLRYKQRVRLYSARWWRCSTSGGCCACPRVEGEREGAKVGRRWKRSLRWCRLNRRPQMNEFTLYIGRIYGRKYWLSYSSFLRSLPPSLLPSVDEVRGQSGWNQSILKTTTTNRPTPLMQSLSIWWIWWWRRRLRNLE